MKRTPHAPTKRSYVRDQHRHARSVGPAGRSPQGDQEGKESYD